MVTSTTRLDAREELFSRGETNGNHRQKSELPPSERDFLVFEAVAFGGASTRQAAAEFDISQTRVMQISRHVARWIATSVPDGLDLTPVQRVRLAAQIASGRVDYLYSLALEAWRASQKPQAGDCRGTRTLRDSHGDPRYLWAAARIAQRQLELAGTSRKVLAEAESGSKFKVQSSKLESAPPTREPAGEGPLDRDCSADAVDWAADHGATDDAVDARGCQTSVCDEIEDRRRAFLAALQDDSAPVHPPFTDAGGMLLDSLEPSGGLQAAAVANARESEDESSIVPLSRKELRRQRRIFARQQRKAK